VALARVLKEILFVFWDCLDIGQGKIHQQDDLMHVTCTV
jgi:hypothetical protein